ncbi:MULTISPECIES: UDP-glucose 4-epimerase GalE [unclassified Leucobacter]|uniref:UDP-glucose 4-epimerase GalE n=1 Tax=unclassified Leucobacter TaxID=2621730 RepID=UPI00165D4D6B|nr:MULTISPECIES: UDP-glucose 4-epimerase GalE [unclassified Leucobacter]MBC9936584.1 UDP-glucose 4-epimerase GalE [Leucobacter sp. cx-87]
MRVLLTGGAGYIGSHTALVLLERGHDVVVLDDYSNGSPEATRRVAELAGREVTSVRADLVDPIATRAALADIGFDAVVHFAGLKAVGESVAQPSRYYRVNLDSTITLLDLMEERGVDTLVFSSSATVYGDPQTPTISESHAVGVGLTNPYGWSKFMNEQVIRDAQIARPELAATLLRYFNPVGAHASGQIGEDPKGTPNNLMPYVAQVASGRRERLAVFGSDYDTPDGTGVRDYIHVMDLAEGHVAALERAEAGVRTYNLGSGIGSSVLQAVRAFERASGREIPFDQVARRPGDVAVVIADPALANAELGWRATRTLDDACRDAWTWQSANPMGYDA